MLNQWLFVEIGGSSTQTAQRDDEGGFRFTPGVIRDPSRSVALACPGVIRGERVLYATNLGWPDEADPAHELGLARVSLVVNDAEAAALGESILRSTGGPSVDLIYVTLGTGLGISCVSGGKVFDPDLAHYRLGGGSYCSGCRNWGCLNSLVCSENLPDPLSRADQAFVAESLAPVLRGADPAGRKLVVVVGGMARRYPAIVSHLRARIPSSTEGSAAPPAAKSAAYAGLASLAARRSRAE